MVQTDPDWCGGITEQVKICAVASAYDVPVIAHGHSLLPALHVAGAQPASVVPEVEYLVPGASVTPGAHARHKCRMLPAR